MATAPSVERNYEPHGEVLGYLVHHLGAYRPARLVGGAILVGGVADSVKAVFVDGTLIAILHNDTEPITWLTRNGIVLMGEPRFDPGRIRVPVRVSVDSGATTMALVHTMEVER